MINCKNKMIIFVYYEIKAKLMSQTLKHIIVISFITSISMAATPYISAQHLSVYSDYLDKVFVFDNGHTRQIEHLPLRSYKIGNHAVSYEDNAGNFKIYQNNYLHNVSAFVSEYKASDNLVVYRMNNQLKVFDNGQNKNLSTNITSYAAGDDVVIFFDDRNYKLMAYYNSKFYELDDALNLDSITGFSCGENTIVYRDSKDYYHIFYDGEIFDLAYYERIKSVSAGRNIVAFVEEPMNNFQVFYNNEIVELESFEPTQYLCGDDLVAYIDANSYLKVFDRGASLVLSFDKPGFFEVHDEMVLFSIQNDFKVYVFGKTFTLENYIPAKYLANNNVVVYIDTHGNLKLFEGGHTKTISYEKINDFELHGNTVKYKFGVKSENIYSNGKTYTNN